MFFHLVLKEASVQLPEHVEFFGVFETVRAVQINT
jgi:hypothetical protein